MADVVAEPRANKLNDRVMRCVNLIRSEDPKQIERALRKLERINMNLDILQETKCGRFVNRLVDDEEVGERASTLVQKWRIIADTEAKKKAGERTDSESPKSNDNHERGRIMIRIKTEPTGNSDHSLSKKHKSRSIKTEASDFEAQLMAADKPSKTKSIKCEPSNDFEAQLLEADKVPKKRKRHDVTETRKSVPDADDIQQTLRQGIESSNPSANGHALTNSVRPSSSSGAMASDELDLSIFKRKERTKVYAGRRKANTEAIKVPTLTQICQRYFQEHIDQLDELGDIPYSLLSGVFERCTTEQLDRISGKNPQLHEDMNVVWVRHVQKVFPGKELERGETWYHCYKRLCRERDERLKTITAKINQRAQKTAANEPAMRTQCTEVINPLRMQKKQIRHGLAPTGSTADARSLSHARREIFNSGSRSELMRMPGGSAAKGSVLATNGRSCTKASQPKKGALMAKSLKMFRSQRR